ncbi:glycosyltransferase [Stappia sp. GBMRC 2046]|uniref:Glycosyltransferase n=1 Tax=Stappia sediminis TaxID=2692190 RepID=A0A7X3S726_9HYPH|nr:glycosyltransferase [Stappia sediminis]MXN64349.1 glycosyltransferase [Stappia sediminis]
MHIALVHRKGPAQFRYLAQNFAEDGWKVTLITQSAESRIRGMKIITYAGGTAQEVSGPAAGSSLMLPHVSAGSRVAEILSKIASREGAPDIVLGHIAWGGMLFVKDALPDTPALGYCEYYFQPAGGDSGFDPTESVGLRELQQMRLRNSTQLTTLDQLDGGISPTHWQRSRYPSLYRPRISVIHEGIDTNRARPDHSATFELPDGTMFAKGDPVITFASRDLEPYRGFPQFMQAASIIAKRNPEARFVVAGGDGVSYGKARDDGLTWREALMRETALPPDRIHFLGQLPHSSLMRLFQVSAAHIYLTYPFVLSWSFLEAMSCGCAVIASATAPVEEVVSDGENGRLVDFWSPQEIAETTLEILRHPGAFSRMRSAARQTVISRYGLMSCLNQNRKLIERMTGTRHQYPAAGIDNRGIYEEKTPTGDIRL